MGLGEAAPDTYYEGFIRLVSPGVLPAPLAQVLAPSAGLRNRLVHEYDVINDVIVYNAVLEALQLYSMYVGEILEYLRKT